MTTATPTFGAHEWVSKMTRYRELSASNLQHLQTLTTARRDFVLPTRCLQVRCEDERLLLSFGKVFDSEAGGPEAARELNAATHERTFTLSSTGLSHLLGRIDLTLRHHDAQQARKRLPLLADYLNACFADPGMRDEAVVVRALEGEPFRSEYTSGTVRAIVSTAYQRFDASDLIENLMPRVAAGEFLLLKALVSRHGESVQIVLARPDAAFEFRPKAGTHGERIVPPADGTDPGLHLPGVSIDLSETGGGAVRAQPMLIRAMCVNGAIIAVWGKRKVHITGERHTVGVPWRTDTVNARREASTKELRDIVTWCMSEQITGQFREALDKAASEEVTAADIAPRIKARLEKGGVGEKAVADIMALFGAQFETGPGRTRYDAAQAITHFRKYDADPDVSPLLETISGELLLA